jgi:hypothetical protein
LSKTCFADGQSADIVRSHLARRAANGHVGVDDFSAAGHGIIPPPEQGELGHYRA